MEIWNTISIRELRFENGMLAGRVTRCLMLLAWICGGHGQVDSLEFRGDMLFWRILADLGLESRGVAEKPTTNSNRPTPELCLACLIPPAIPTWPQRIDCPPTRLVRRQPSGCRPETLTLQASSSAINAARGAKTTGLQINSSICRTGKICPWLRGLITRRPQPS
jgi:hypothetical protein